jgi:hypothetical protein
MRGKVTRLVVSEGENENKLEEERPGVVEYDADECEYEV